MNKLKLTPPPNLFYFYMTVHITYDKMIDFCILYKLLKNMLTFGNMYRTGKGLSANLFNI